jgi:rhomboid protease GluP
MASLMGGRKLVLGLIAICVCIEAVLTLADWDLIPVVRLRALAYENFGFWPGLVRGWDPNYDAQPYTMFVTYGFLHGGLIHLAVNMITLWSLAEAVLDRVRLRGFVILYVTTLVGGAGGYALLSSAPQPMVGASGALFGLVGGLLAWLYVDLYIYERGLLPVAQAVLLLILLNLVLWWAMDGQLAWETHLGGFISGWIVALLIDPRATDPAERT